MRGYPNNITAATVVLLTNHASSADNVPPVVSPYVPRVNSTLDDYVNRSGDIYVSRSS